MAVGIDDLKFVVTEFRNSPPQLYECEKNDLDICAEDVYYGLIFPRAELTRYSSLEQI